MALPELNLTLGGHLKELRTRLWKVVLAVLVLGGLALAWAREIFAVLMAPVLAALPEDSRALVYTSGIEEINVLLKVGLYAGLFLSAPVALYQFWSFIAPGLLPQERRHVGPFVALGTAFFIGGAAFCYFAVLPTMFQFLLRPGESGPVRERITLARGQADDAGRLLALGEIHRASAMAEELEAALGADGDGRIGAPAVLSSSPMELNERLTRLGRLLDTLIPHGAGPGKRHFAEAIALRGEAEKLLAEARLDKAALKLEDAAVTLGRALGAEAETLGKVWSAERHLAAAQGRLKQEEWTRPMLSMREQLSLVLLLEVAFGAIFELPLIMAVLAVVGILRFRFVARYQRQAIILCVVLAAVITPTGDVINLALMALPMIACFELGVLLVFIFDRRRTEQQQQEDDPADANAA